MSGTETTVDKRLAGRRALVTGGASGIGLASARRMAQEGATAAIVDARTGAAEAAASKLVADGLAVIGLAGDVGDEPSIEDAVGRAVGELGGLDTVVAAAGIVRSGHTHETPLTEWETTIRVNLTGVFLTVKHTVPHLLDAGGGAMVTIGSVASLVAAGRTASYDASKGGVLQLTRAVAVEYASDRIRANCVCPGPVRTELFATSDALYGPAASDVNISAMSRLQLPMDRFADPEEVAAVVTFLCSDEASFMTGAAVTVDGGYTAI